MEETKLDIKPKITRSSLRLSALDNLKEATEETKKSSEKLKRLFERNTYQKKTQLTVLKRYKRRLDAIEREEEARRKRAARKKIKVPQIKKFVGSFFAPNASNDPLKALGTLAAFNTATNLAQGKWFDAFITGLTATGLVAGPALLGMGVNRMINRNGFPFRRGPRVTENTGGFRNPFRRGPRVTGDTGRFKIKNPFRRGPRVTGEVGRFGKIGKAFTRFGKSAIPIAGAALGAADAAIRASEGDVTGASIAGTSATLDAISAGLTATGIGVFPAAVLSAVSFGLDLVNLVRDLSGASEKESEKNKKKKKDDKRKTIEDRLKEQTQKQKEEVKRNDPELERGPLTFGKTLDGYEKVIKKFEEFSKNFKGTAYGPEDTIGEGEDRRNDSGGPIDPSNAEVPTTPEGLPALPPTNLLRGQAYGAPRRYGGHSGQDFDINGNEKFYSRLGGQVIFAKDIGGEYGNVVEVYNKDLGITEVIAEANHIMPDIKEGMNIPPGTAVVYGERTKATAGGSVGVVHYEIVKGVGGISSGNRNTMNPLDYLNSKEYKDYIKKKVKPQSINPKQLPRQPITPRQSPQPTQGKTPNQFEGGGVNGNDHSSTTFKPLSKEIASLRPIEQYSDDGSNIVIFSPSFTQQQSNNPSQLAQNFSIPSGLNKTDGNIISTIQYRALS